MPELHRDMTAEEIEAFRAPFRRLKQEGKVSAALRGALVGAFAPLKSYAVKDGKSVPQQYAEALEDAFYADGAKEGRHRLSARDRERVLIPLLASRGDDFALAVHIYLGWLEDLDEDEIGELLFLGGVYTGISHMTRGLEVAKRTFELVTREDPRRVTFPEMLGKLKAFFMPVPLPAPPPPPPGPDATGRGS
jgi:alkylhydroperoxidase/carboxymuconolactone decarboxylase family protein YurZ